MTVGEITARLTLDLSSFTTGLQRAEKLLNDHAQAMQRAGATLAGFGAALTGALTGAAKVASDFEAQMRNVNSIVKASEAALQGMSQQVLGLSRSSGQGPATLAAGLYDIASSGFAGADGMKVLEAAAKAATAGLTTTATASKAVTAVLNAYGLGADQAARVSDVLFQTVNLGVITFDELATQLGDVVSTAAQANVPIEQVAAAISTMTRAGVQPAEAVTSLNQTLLSFIDPTDDAKKAAASLGVELSATALASQGLSGVMQQIASALGTTSSDLDALAASGKSEAEIMQAVAERSGSTSEAMAKLFPNVRALRGALVLAAGGAKEFEGDLRAMAQAAGVTDQVFAEQSKSTQVQWAKMKATLEAAAVVIGNQLLPALQPMITALASLATKASEWMNANQGLAKALVVVATGVGTFSLAVGGLLFILPQLVAGIAALPVALGAVQAAIGALLGPVGLAVAGVTALGGAIYALVTRLRGAKEASKEQTEATRRQHEEHLRLAQRAQELATKTRRTQEEHRELHETMNRLAEVYPSLVERYDAEGNAVVSLTALLKKLNEQQREDLRLAEERAKAHRQELAGRQADLKAQIEAKAAALNAAKARKAEPEERVEKALKDKRIPSMWDVTTVQTERQNIERLQQDLRKLREDYAAVEQERKAAFAPIIEKVKGAGTAAPIPSKQTEQPSGAEQPSGVGGGSVAAATALSKTRLEVSQEYQRALKAEVELGRRTWAEYLAWRAAAFAKYRQSEDTAEKEFAASLLAEMRREQEQASKSAAEIYAERAGQLGAAQEVMEAFAANLAAVSEEAARRQQELEADWFQWRLEQGQIDLRAYVAECEAKLATTRQMYGEESREALEAEKRLASVKEQFLRQSLALIDEEIAAYGAGYEKKIALLQEAAAEAARAGNISDQLSLQATIRQTAAEAAEGELALLDLQQMTLEQQYRVVQSTLLSWEQIAGTTLPSLRQQLDSISREIAAMQPTWANILWGAYQGVESALTGFFDSLLQRTASWADLVQGLIDSVRASFAQLLAKSAAQWLYGKIFGGGESAEAAARTNLLAGGEMVTAAMLNKLAAQNMMNAANKMLAASAGEAGGSVLGTVASVIGSIFGLASGGVVTRPTLAVVGEAGPEAVVPLTQMRYLLPMVGAASERREGGAKVQFAPGAIALTLDSLSDWQLHRLADRLAAVLGDRFVPFWERTRGGD